MPVQHAEDEALGGQIVAAHVASVRHRQPTHALQHRLQRHGPQRINQALAHEQGLAEGRVRDPFRMNPLSFVGCQIERMVQGFPHSRSRMSVQMQHLGEETQSVAGKTLCLLRVSQPAFHQGSGLDLPLERRGVHVGEQSLAGEHGEEHDAAAPDVALRPVDAVPELGRHVRGGALNLVPLPVEAAAHPQIDHHQALQVLA
mmetsp:Transcript_32558/g.91558  ORF Transcript_32558/g.91558 Transcript_32558/m.91558 type:complete len:201 (-) Transcript_32558:571-1173(-)